MARHPKRSGITGRVRRECVRQRTSNARWLHLSAGEASNRQVIQFSWGLTVNAALIFTTYSANTLLIQQLIGDPTLSADLGFIATAFIGAAMTYSQLANQYLQLDIDLHDVPDHEYAQSQTFKPRRYIKIDDLSDMEAHKMTHFYRDELKRIYQCFGPEDYVLMHGDGIHICVSTASDAHPGRKNNYKLEPEEKILYTLCRVATRLPSATILDMYFGRTY